MKTVYYASLSWPITAYIRVRGREVYLRRRDSMINNNRLSCYGKKWFHLKWNTFMHYKNVGSQWRRVSRKQALLLAAT